jgi:hypothetical protein
MMFPGQTGHGACLKRPAFGLQPFGQAESNASGGPLMLRTIFLLASAMWMLGLMLQFGGSVLPLLLVIASLLLVMKHIFRRPSLY